jgi:hypothetical protein
MGMDFIYLPAGDGEPFVGAAVISGSEPFVGAVDEVKYLGDDEDTGHAMSYMVESDAVATNGETLVLPLYQKGNAQTGGGDTSGIQLFNPSGDSVEFAVRFRRHSDGGSQLLLFGQKLGPLESTTLYAHELDTLPEGFNGSVIVEPAGEGSLVGVSNNVNYDVQLDGSASFNMIVISHPGDPPEPPFDIILP